MSVLEPAKEIFVLRPDFFLLVGLREFFFRSRVDGGMQKINKKALKMTS